eukprot:scaffold23023_cov18-Prasinocladus_malaysianus.AAC.1
MGSRTRNHFVAFDTLQYNAGECCTVISAMGLGAGMYQPFTILNNLDALRTSPVMSKPAILGRLLGLENCPPERFLIVNNSSLFVACEYMHRAV